MSGEKPFRQLSRTEQVRKDRGNQPAVPPRHIPAPPVSRYIRNDPPAQPPKKLRRFRSTADNQIHVFTRNNQTKSSSIAKNRLKSIPVFNRTGGNVWKKYIIALNQRGSSLVLPSLPILKGRSRWVSGSLAGILALMILIYSVVPTFRAHTIEFTGLNRIAASDVEQILGLKNLPIYMINPERVASKLILAYPELVDPQIKANIPGKVSITVSERIPVIEWSYNGLLLWIDKEGYIFFPRGEIDRIGLIVINSDVAPPPAQAVALTTEEIINQPTPTPTPQVAVLEDTEITVLEDYVYMDKAIIEAATTLVEAVPAGVPLIYSKQNGIGWTDPKGWDVYVGLDLDNLDERLALYQSIVTELTRQGITPQMISVEFLNAPFYRK